MPTSKTSILLLVVGGSQEQFWELLQNLIDGDRSLCQMFCPIYLQWHLQVLWVACIAHHFMQQIYG